MTKLFDTATGELKPIPPPPPQAKSYKDRNGTDTVYDLDHPEHPRRWRYRGKELIVFIVYEYYDFVHPETIKAAGLKKGTVERSVRSMAEFRE